MYVNDLAIWTSETCKNFKYLKNKIENRLQKLHGWAKKNFMEINIEKTKF